MSISKNRFFSLVLTTALFFLACVGCGRTGTDSVYLYAEDDTVQIHNADGESWKLTDGRIEGKGDMLNIVSQSEHECMAEVPYSDSFAFEGSEDKKVKYSVLTSLDRLAGAEYTVSGIGVSAATISPDGKMLIDGNNFTFEAFGSMRDGVLGSYGNVRLSGAAEISVEIRFDEQNNTIFFAGVIPELVLMTVNGNVSANSIVIPSSGSGTISLADLDKGTITVTDASGNLQTISVEIYAGQADS